MAITLDGTAGITTPEIISTAGPVVIDASAANNSLVVVANGNVGIGSSSPSGKLEVNTGSLAAYFTRTAGDTGVLDPAFGIATASTTNRLGSSGDLQFMVGSVGTAAISQDERMRIAANGNVGIGTTAPAGRLHARFDAGSGDGHTAKYIFQSLDQRLTIGTYYEAGVAQNARIQSSSGSGVVTSLILNPDGGNVGIGTTAPGRKLDVTGIIRSDGTSGAFALGGNSSTPAEGAAIHRPAADTLAFVTASTERMRIYSDGTVGIFNLAGAGSRTVTAGSGGVLAAASDSRLKQEVPTAPIPGLAEIMRLEPRAYKWLDDIENRGEDASVEIGFFADQVKDIIPSAAPMGNDGYYGFYDRAVIAALTKAVQEQQVLITALTDRIEALETTQ